tara:strand:+ start:621 stop:2921 length:2301 start_codon:yes stop_codon:yes gene_type:complete
MTGCLSGEDLVDDILGCVDENAVNYDENATTELIGDCIYLASIDAFMTSMDKEMGIHGLLEDSPKAGYSQTIAINTFEPDMGMQIEVTISEQVMVDMNNNSVYVHTAMSYDPMITIEYTHIQVGEVVNVHYSMGGMMAAQVGGADSGSYQTRDATPNILEVIDSVIDSSDSGDEMIELPDTGDFNNDMPDNATTEITYNSAEGTQKMEMHLIDEDGTEMTMNIEIDENENLVSYSMHSSNGSDSMSMHYLVMWDDAIVIEVDDTLPRTSIPVWIDVQGEGEFVCGSGETIPIDWVDDGWEDCDDGSDESPDVMYLCDSGEEVHWGSINDGYDDCYDGSDEATFEGGDDGEPNFIEESSLSCTRMMDTSMVQNDAADEWDGTNLDMSDCGGEPTEYYTDYVVGDTPVTAPYSITILVSEEDWSEMTGDDTGDYCEENGGTYDSDNDVCDLTFEGFRNDTHLQEPIHNWIDQSGAEDAEDAEMYCSNWVGGSYDADDDICLEPVGEIIEADGGALLINDGGEFFSFYFLDESTGSGFLAEIETSYGLLCDNGQVVDEYAYDDGWEDCDDGSDEPYQGEETSEFECADGTVIPFSWVNDWGDDCPDGSDEEWFYQSTDNGDENNQQSDTLPPVITGFVADNQTLNAPITDFEVHFISDCEGEYDEDTGMMTEPDLNDCTNEFSIPLTGGEAGGVTLSYIDHDADGFVSPGDEVSIDWGDYEGDAEPELYDTWASEYSVQSAAMPPALPGFGALLGALCLLGAAFASRRD